MLSLLHHVCAFFVLSFFRVLDMLGYSAKMVQIIKDLTTWGVCIWFCFVKKGKPVQVLSKSTVTLMELCHGISIHFSDLTKLLLH